MKKNNWILTTITEGHLSCENLKLESAEIRNIEAILEKKFGNQLKRHGIIVSYDCWSGVFIMPFYKDAECYAAADSLIKQIYDYLCELENGAAKNDCTK